MKSGPHTHIKRQATQHDRLPSLLGDEGKWSDFMYGEGKNILYWADRSSQGRTKIVQHNEPGTRRPMQGRLFLKFTSVYNFKMGTGGGGGVPPSHRKEQL